MVLELLDTVIKDEHVDMVLAAHRYYCSGVVRERNNLPTFAKTASILTTSLALISMLRVTVIFISAKTFNFSSIWYSYD